MKKNIVLLVGGVIAGFALCLTTAALIPCRDEEESFDQLERTMRTGT